MSLLFNSESVATDRHATLKGQTVTVNGRLKQVSLNGVGVESSKNASIGTRLEVIFELPALGEFNEMMVYGLVRGRHSTSDGGYYLKIEFEGLLDRHETEVIEDFLDYKKRLRKLGDKYHYGSNS